MGAVKNTIRVQIGRFLHTNQYTGYVVSLFNIGNNQIGELLFGVAVGVDHKVVIAGIITARTSMALDIILAGLVNTVDNGNS